MRIVIDLQAAQGASRWRGMGRYSLWLALAMVRNRRDHEIIIALSDQFPDTIDELRDSFDGLLPQENIRVWRAAADIAHVSAGNDWRRRSVELVREAFFASLNPDVVHVCSLFEGLGENFATSVGEFSQTIPTAVTLYDLIPLIHQDIYLHNSEMKAWYFEKIEYLRRADLWLAISASSRREGIEYLGLPAERTVNISSDVDPIFCKRNISAEHEAGLRERYGLDRPFVMYTGGIDHRKNFEGLIRAFAGLEDGVRNAHQLAIVCSASNDNLRVLEQLAADHGLAKEQMVLTGYIPDDDLIDLYNLCALFVFPSWHEGFGLPALEAMRCGAPVIGANTTSLPEVIGWEDALFDPHSDASITEKMQRGLTDVHFRSRLLENAAVQSPKFSWDATANRAIAAMEQLHAARQQVPIGAPSATRKPRLAYVSPLPPLRSGIADYSAELLPELSAYYDIDVIVDQDTISDDWVASNCHIRNSEWLVDYAADYDRVIYHFGNSAFHAYMFDLLKRVPGVVVQHDFYLSHIIAHMDWRRKSNTSLAAELYRSHGFRAVAENSHGADAIWTYPCNLGVVQDSLGVIVHSQNSVRLARDWYGCHDADWAVIPLLRNASVARDRKSARQSTGFTEEDFVVCAFGLLGPTKLNQRLVDAWRQSSLAQNPHCHLVFVGELDAGDYGDALLKSIRRDVDANIRITGWTDADVFRDYLGTADLGVQLRTMSRGETSAAVLDCMNFGLPTIVNANGSMADFSPASVLKIPDRFSDQELVNALEAIYADADLRARLGSAARDVILRCHDPARCALDYNIAIERFYQRAALGTAALLNAVVRNPVPAVLPEQDVVQLADSIGRNLPLRNRQRQLLVDISEFVQRDSRSGIQRVVRSILLDWLGRAAPGYRIEPVYATLDQPYRYARVFSAETLGIADAGLVDEPVEFVQGDIFVGLDLQLEIVWAQRAQIAAMRRWGVKVLFVVYDLLHELMPQHFRYDEGNFARWLDVITQSDGAICISQSVANELSAWVADNGKLRQRPLAIDWFHLGADVENSAPTLGLPANADAVLDTLRSRPTFLMVGTVEPRKGHAQVLGAFEELWRPGASVNLVIVGRPGWMTEDVMHRLRTHPDLGKRLFWLDGISDEYLEKVYAVSACLLAASEGEGFGLPLIEAARYGLPILARDIPVFREVAGAHASYFAGLESSELAQAITVWLRAYQQNLHPTSKGMKWLTWEQSAAQLLGVVLGRAAPLRKPGEVDLPVAAAAE